MHADWTLLPRRQFLKRAQIHLGTDIELAFSFIKHLLDTPALLLMLLPVSVLTILVAIPNALAGPALFEGICITLLAARRTQQLPGRGGPILLGVLVLLVGFVDLSFHSFAERHGAELVSRR
jgi:uncharacterized membrane protein HdeD (DUF308 family)